METFLLICKVLYILPILICSIAFVNSLRRNNDSLKVKEVIQVAIFVFTPFLNWYMTSLAIKEEWKENTWLNKEITFNVTKHKQIEKK